MKQIIATNKAPGAIGPYSQGTSCDKLVFTSGQLGIDPATGKLAGQSVEEQTMQALKNLAGAAAGVAGVSLAGLLAGMGCVLLKRKKQV